MSGRTARRRENRFGGGDEPPLQEALGDPVIQQMMARDHVTRADIEALTKALAGRAGPPPGR